MPAAWLAEGDASARASSSAPSSSLSHYQLKKQVYKGAVSRVYEAFDRRDGAHVCLKIYKRSALNALQRAQLDRELEIHSRLSHPNIAQLHECFEDDRAVYMVQEFVDGGDLYTALITGGKFDEYRAAGVVVTPLLQALRYVHGRGIIHRDIKAENILVDPDGTVKLADFGFAIDTNDARPGSRLGTWEYMAPEIHLCPFKNESKGKQPDMTYSAAVDIWAIGVLAYEVLTGKPPFPNKHGEITHQQLMESELHFPAWMSPDSVSFIKAALCKDPDLRPTARQLLKHRWLRAFQKDAGVAKTVASGTSAGNVLTRMAAAISKSLDTQSLVTSSSNAASATVSSAAAASGGGVSGVASAVSAITAAATARLNRRLPTKVNSLHNLVFHQQGGMASAHGGAAGSLLGAVTGGPTGSPMARGLQDAKTRRFTAQEEAVELSSYSATVSSMRQQVGAYGRGFAENGAAPTGFGRARPDAPAATTAFAAHDGNVTSADASEPLARVDSGTAPQHQAPGLPPGAGSLSEPLPEPRMLSLPALKVTRSIVTLAQSQPQPLNPLDPTLATAPSAPVGTPMRTRRGSTVMVMVPPASPTTPTSPSSISSPLSDQGAGAAGVGAEGRRPSGALTAAPLAPMPPVGALSPTAPGITSNRFRRASRLSLAVADAAGQQLPPSLPVDAEFS